jgi:transposase
MAKYSYELKLSVVQHYLQDKDGYRSTSYQFQVDNSAVRKWVALYKLHGAEALKKKPNANYSPAFKRSVIEHMRAHMLSIKQTAAHFNIPAFSSVTAWEKLYDTGKIATPTVRRGRPKAMAKTPPPPPEKPLEEMSHQELMAEVRYLRTEHAYLKKLDALIQRKQLEEKNKQK